MAKTQSNEDYVSLAFPTNIARRENPAKILCALMRSLPGPLMFHVCDGQVSGHLIDDSEIESTSKLIANCSLIYILEGTRGTFEPIAGFIANESLGRARLLHLIDDRPGKTTGALPCRTVDHIGAYVRSMLAEYDWLNAVTVPAVVDSLNGFAGLKVVSSEISTITLADAAHRPNSSRRR